MSPNAEQLRLSVETIVSLAKDRALNELWLDHEGARTWFDFGAAIDAVRRKCGEAGVVPGSVVITPGESSFEALAWIFGVAAIGAVVAPLRPQRIGEIETWKQSIPLGWQVIGERLKRVDSGSLSIEARGLFDELSARNHPGLILATGGTTGVPKLVLHDLAALWETVGVREGPVRRLLPLMHFDHIGGLDMAWRALAGQQILVAPPAVISPASVAATIARHQVQVLPATPSFLNLLLMAEAHRQYDLSSLRLIPYGAEPMPAALLSRLRSALPQVDFIQRFGTSETGALPVRDTGAGLQLSDRSNGFAWKIVDQELWIQSPSRALGYLMGKGTGFQADGWFRTGDLAEPLPDGSLRVLGRREELINVGGEKVLPSEVESLLLEHPLVSDCRVGPAPNAILGQVVAAEIVWLGEERNAVLVKRILHAHSAGRIARHKLPTLVRLVESIGSTRNLKKQRAP